jgi:hypothetical protein
MLAEFETLTVTTLVSESGDYQRYDLGDEKKIAVKAWGGETLLRNFEIGKAAPSFRHTFVKLADDDRVYHARNNFRNTFDKTMDSMRDKAVLSFQTADITEFQLADEKTSLTFTLEEMPAAEPQAEAASQPTTDQSTAERAKKVWQGPDGKNGDDLNINRLLAVLSNLRCDTYIEDRKKDDFTSPVYTIDLKGVQNHKLSIFTPLKPDDPNYPAISSGSDYPFLLTKNTVDRIRKKPEDLLVKSSDENESEAQKPE